MIRNTLMLMRIKNWYKNFLVFVALVFSGKMFDQSSIILSLIAFFSLCVISSGTYVANDVLDAEKDRLHPEKKLRPIASCKISPIKAIILSLSLYALGFFIAGYLSTQFVVVAALLTLGGTAYSLALKHYAFVDVTIIACFFVLRALAGGIALGIALSPWLFLGSFVLALFLAIIKRKADLNLLGDYAKQHRKSLGVYTHKIIDSITVVSVSVLLMAYSAYSFLSGKHSFFFLTTIPLAFFSVFRYVYLCEAKPEICRKPELFYHDIPLLISIIIWVVIVIADIYFIRGLS